MQASTFIAIGRSFLGLCIAGIGLVHFFLPGVRPIVAPLPPEMVWQPLGYLVGGTLTLAGAALLLDKGTRTVSLCLGALLLLFLLFGHLPSRINNHPEILGYWTDAIKLIALAGGAFVLSGISREREVSAPPEKIVKVAHYGQYLYAFMLVVFGLDHFLYHDLVKTMVPGWIPNPLLWTYLTGVALVGSGISIFINFKVALISLLLATMLLLWLVLLHIPATLTNPFGNGNPIISALECMAFSGIALLITALALKNKTVKPELILRS